MFQQFSKKRGVLEGVPGQRKVNVIHFYFKLYALPYLLELQISFLPHGVILCMLVTLSTKPLNSLCINLSKMGHKSLLKFQEILMFFVLFCFVCILEISTQIKLKSAFVEELSAADILIVCLHRSSCWT